VPFVRLLIPNYYNSKKISQNVKWQNPNAINILSNLLILVKTPKKLLRSEDMFFFKDKNRTSRNRFSNFPSALDS